jgi:uncharacterized membrane protein
MQREMQRDLPFRDTRQFADRGRWVTLGLAAAAVTVAAVAIGRRRRSGDPVPDRSSDSAHAIDTSASITIWRSIEDVYQFWRNFENFPHFMRDLESVQVTGERRSHWTLTGPAGFMVEWDAELVSDQPNHLISWRSLPDSTVPNRGAVWFEDAPGGRGTEVHVGLQYQPPAGPVGHAIAWVFGKTPHQQVREGLRRVKQLLEVGEIVLSDGPGLSRPAQPLDHPQEARTLVGVRA